MHRSHSYQLALIRSSTKSASQLGSDVKLFSYTTNLGVEPPLDEPPVMGGSGELPVAGGFKAGSMPVEAGVVPVIEVFGTVG